MHVHGETVQVVYRGYDHPDGYRLRHKYRFVAVVFLLGERARAFATMGELGRLAIQGIAEDLLARGVKTLLVERHGVEQSWQLGRATSHPRKPS